MSRPPEVLPSQWLRLGHHDLGGDEGSYGPIDISQHDYEQWEIQIHACLSLCLGKNLMNVDQLRKGIEGMQPEAYGEAGYYERWAVSLARHLVESQAIPQATLDRHLGVVPRSRTSMRPFRRRVSMRPLWCRCSMLLDRVRMRPGFRRRHHHW